MKAEKILKLLKKENENALEFWSGEIKRAGGNMSYMIKGRLSTINEIKNFIEKLENE